MIPIVSVKQKDKEPAAAPAPGAPKRQDESKKYLNPVSLAVAIIVWIAGLAIVVPLISHQPDGVAFPSVFAVMLVGMAKMFVKAKQPAWAVLIPIYNLYVLIKVAGKPGWWLLLLCVPIVNIVVCILAMTALASRFGKGGGFAAGLIFFPYIFCPILGLGKAQYTAATVEQG